jgi:ketosteroid isomerase-like protein
MPAQIHNSLTRRGKAYNSGDVDALVELYEPDAMVFPQPGNAVTGRDAIREALVPLVALGDRSICELPL